MSELRSQSVSIYSIYYPAYGEAGGLTRAYFGWAFSTFGISQLETYAAAISDKLSIEFDKHIPVRPISITVMDNNMKAAAAALEALFGHEISTVITETRSRGGLVITTITLSSEHRFLLAGLQTRHPATPRLLAFACQAMTDIHAKAIKKRLPPNTNIQSSDITPGVRTNTSTDTGPTAS